HAAIHRLGERRRYALQHADEVGREGCRVASIDGPQRAELARDLASYGERATTDLARPRGKALDALAEQGGVRARHGGILHRTGRATKARATSPAPRPTRAASTPGHRLPAVRLQDRARVARSDTGHVG